jgi:hypothetical protein
MTARVVLASFALLCPAVACAGAPKDPQAHEGQLEPPREFGSADGSFKARAPAKVEEVRDTGDGHVVSFDIGSEAQLVCRITAGESDMADAMRRSFDLTLQNLKDVHGSIQMLGPEAPDAGAIGDVPYLAMHWTYGTSDGSKFLRVGSFKQIAFYTRGHNLSCWHLDSGYAHSFATVTSALAESFESAAKEAAPYFVEIKRSTTGRFRLGVVTSTLQRDASGAIRGQQITEMMIPGSGEMHSHQADHQVQLRADGSLANAAHIIRRDGTIAMKIELSQRNGQWVVEGMREGNPINAKLPAGVRPGNWVEQARDLRSLLAAENPVGADYTRPMWIAAKPTELVDMRIRVLEKKSPDEFTAELTLPRYESRIVLDRATGLACRAEVPRGLETVHVERVYVSGSP